MNRSSFIIISLALASALAVNAVPNQNALESIEPENLDALLKAGRIGDILNHICPEPKNGFKTCEAQSLDAYKKTGDKSQITAAGFGGGRLHTHYGTSFLEKTFMVDEELELNHAINEINTGLRIKDSIRINQVENLTPLQSCCRDTDPLNAKPHVRFYLRFQQYPLGNLQEFIKNRNYERLTSSTTWKFVAVEGILNGLASLHNRKFIHRDLKPTNTLMMDAWSPMLADFGCAKKFDGTQNTIVGTPLLLAPEMKNEQSYSLKLDIWNAGAMIFYIVAPRTFTWTQDWAEIARKACANLVPSKLTMDDESFVYCHYFDGLIRSMLSEKPEDRPTAMQALENVWNQVERIIQHQNFVYENFAAELRTHKLPANHRFWRTLKASYENVQKRFARLALPENEAEFVEHLRDIHPGWFVQNHPFADQLQSWAENYKRWVGSNPQIPKLEPDQRVVV